MGLMDRLSLMMRAPVSQPMPRHRGLLMPPGSLGARIGSTLTGQLGSLLQPRPLTDPNPMLRGQRAITGEAVVPGPRVVAFGYDFGPMTTALMRAAQHADLLDVLEHQVGVEWAAVHRARGLFWYSVPNPQPFTVPATAFDGVGLEAAIGVDRMTQPVDVDFRRTPHLLVAMPTGGGKTTAVQALLYRLCTQLAPADVRLIVVASRMAHWRPLEALPHLWGIVHHNDSAPVLEWVLREVERREARGVTEPPVMLVLDDVHSAVTRGGILAETMTTVSQNARAAGVHLIITAHGTDAKNLGSADVERNIGLRIVAATSASNAAQMTGRGGTGAHRLLGEGEGIFVNGPNEMPVTLAVVKPDDFYALGARWGMDACEPAPWAEAEKPKPTVTLIQPQIWQDGPRSASEAEPEAETEAETSSVVERRNAPAERPASRLLTERERRVRDLLRERKTQAEILADVWRVSAGGGGAYKAACNEYRDVLARLVEVSA